MKFTRKRTISILLIMATLVSVFAVNASALTTGKWDFSGATSTIIQQSIQSALAKQEADNAAEEETADGPTSADSENTAVPASEYTITYDANGGCFFSTTSSSNMQTLKVKTQQKEAGEDCTIMSWKPFRGGYTFTGWLDTETGEVYAPGDTYDLDADLYLKAQWKWNLG